MNSTASAGRSASASAAQSQSRLRPSIIQHLLTTIEIEGTRLMPATCLVVQPRSILALLVYHYAQGKLSSHEIESTLWTDPQLRLLCRDRLPDWRELRQFRRLHHGILCECLAHVLASELNTTADLSSATDEAEQRLSEAAILDELFADE